MQSLKEIMEEMGFNKEASYESQKAFIRHLINAANQQKPPQPVIDRRREDDQASSPKLTEKKPELPIQLEFDLSG